MKTITLTIKSLLMAVTAMLSLVACQKMPVACCEISKTAAAVNEQIIFNANCSINSYSCEWDFGDGSKSTDFKSSHAYTAAGQYSVSMMTMSRNDKKMDEIKKTITIQ